MHLKHQKNQTPEMAYHLPRTQNPRDGTLHKIQSFEISDCGRCEKDVYADSITLRVEDSPLSPPTSPNRPEEPVTSEFEEQSSESETLKKILITYILMIMLVGKN